MNQDVKKILKISGLAIFFILIAVYAFFRSHDLIFGVKLKNIKINGSAVADGIKMPENISKITGNAQNAINLTLNGREISIDQDGDFNETIVLLSGYNMINIRAQDKFGNVDEKTYQLIY